jgi:hypothetical protein
VQTLERNRLAQRSLEYTLIKHRDKRHSKDRKIPSEFKQVNSLRCMWCGGNDDYEAGKNTETIRHNQRLVKYYPDICQE